MTIQVFLGGEGANELGCFARKARPEGATREPGVVEALLTTVQSDGWRAVDGVCWKNIRKYKAGGRVDAETRNVRGLVEMAERAGADAVAFVRDSDGDKKRAQVISAAIDEVTMTFPKIIGGCPNPTLEAWLLALNGQCDTERMTKDRALKRLTQMGVPPKNTAAMVEFVRQAPSFDNVPRDAASLHAWHKLAKKILTDLGEARPQP